MSLDVKALAIAFRQVADAACDDTIKRVYLFGSQLLGATQDSDVDVLIVRDDGADLAKVSAISKQMSSRFHEMTGLRLDQSRVSESELAESGFLSTIASELVWTRDD